MFIWPESIGRKYKDFNELCVALKINEIPVESVTNETLCGEAGLMKYKIIMKNR